MKCPCGYDKECAVHCGYGHYNGQCDPYDATDPRSQYKLESEHLVPIGRKLAPSEPIDSLDSQLRNLPLATTVKENGSVWLSDNDIQAIKDLFSRESSKREAEIRKEAKHEERGLAISYMQGWKYRNDYIKKSKLLAELESGRGNI